eukprot:9152675-Pyramimonas_sp.AAC.1
MNSSPLGTDCWCPGKLPDAVLTSCISYSSLNCASPTPIRLNLGLPEFSHPLASPKNRIGGCGQQVATHGARWPHGPRAA